MLIYCEAYQAELKQVFRISFEEYINSPSCCSITKLDEFISLMQKVESLSNSDPRHVFRGHEKIRW